MLLSKLSLLDGYNTSGCSIIYAEGFLTYNKLKGPYEFIKLFYTFVFVLLFFGCVF